MRVIHQPDQEPPIRFEPTLNDHLIDWVADRIEGIPSFAAQTVTATTVLMPLIGYGLAKEYVMDLPQRTTTYMNGKGLQTDLDGNSLQHAKGIAATLAYAFGAGGLEKLRESANGRSLTGIATQSIGGLAAGALHNLQNPHI